MNLIKKQRYFLRLAYDGTNFCGWQNQKNQESVQGSIESALSALYRSPQAVLGCGRTDTGVHADDYIAHWDCPGDLIDGFLLKINGILPRSIVIKDIFPVDAAHNARFSATTRTYHYFFHTQKNPFSRLYSYECLHQKIDIQRMQEAAKILLNYNEFLPLIKLDKETNKTNCILFSGNIEQLGPYSFRYEISANRFLHNMVRRIVGTLLLIGREKMTKEEFIIGMDNQSEFRLKALAPANGLHLVNISYPFLEND